MFFSPLKWPISLLILLLQAGSAVAASRTLALLVGVSQYPSLPQYDQLVDGPKNDILLFKQYLQSQGVPEQAITTLTEGEDAAHLPTREAIQAGFNTLAEKANKGDFVFIMFSGHGSEQPSKDDLRIEPDGMDQTFLPRNVGRWHGGTETVQNALTDNEIGAAIQRIRQRGAFVWAVFDSCHSGTLTRAIMPRGEQTREINPIELGVPQAELTKAKQRAAIAATRRQHDESASQLGSLGVETNSGEGGYVVFYSAQREQQAPQDRLPHNARDAKRYGLFSYNLFSALANNPGASYRQIMQQVWQRYQALHRTDVAPGFEGTALDASAFGSTDHAPVVQWQVQPRNTQLMVRAGLLQGITNDSVLSIVPEAVSKDKARIGYVKVTDAGLTESYVTPVAYQDTSTFSWPESLQSAYARAAELKIDFSLKVALPEKGDVCDAPSETLKLALQQIRGQMNRRLTWVKQTEAADVRLCEKNGRLHFLDASGTLDSHCSTDCDSLALNPADAQQRSATQLSPLAETLAGNLQRINKVIDIYRVIALSPVPKENLQVSVGWCHPALGEKGCNKFKSIDGNSRPVIRTGDHIEINLNNTSGIAMDVSVLSINAHYGIDVLFPQNNDDPRLLPDSKVPIKLQWNLGGLAQNLGPANLIVLAVPNQPLAEKVSFESLAQRALDTSTRRGSVNSRLLALLQDAAFGQKTRGDSNVESVSVSGFRWTVAL